MKITDFHDDLKQYLLPFDTQDNGGIMSIHRDSGVIDFFRAKERLKKRSPAEGDNIINIS